MRYSKFTIKESKMDLFCLICMPVYYLNIQNAVNTSDYK